MTQQRQNETEEEYKKRKKRVRLVMMGGSGGTFVRPTIDYLGPLNGFKYFVDPSGNTVIDNQGSGGDTYDGQAYSGRGIELGATNDVDIPIHHTLGAEEVTNGTFDADTDWIKGIGWTIATGVASCDGTQITNTGLQQSGIAVSGKTYLIEFDLVVTAGVITWVAIGGAIDNTNLTTSGHYAVELTATNTDNLSIAGDLDFIGSIDNVSVKQITNPNSYLTYYNFTDGLVTLGNSVDGGSSDNLELITNHDMSTGDTTGWNEARNASTLSIVNGKLMVEADGASTFGVSSDGIPLSNFDSTRSYLVKIVVDIGTATTLLARGDLTSTLSTAAYINETITASGTYYIPVATNPTGTSYWGIISTDDNVYFNIEEFSIREILPISTKYTLNTKTVNNIITHTTPWSALDWVKINNNPNLVGKLALETTGATKTIPELDMELDQGASADSYNMCSEKSGAYLVDSRVAYGAEVLTNSDCSSTTGWSSTFGTIASDGNLITVTTDATLTETLIWQDNLTLNGKYAVIEIDVDTMPENYSKFEFQIRESFASATQIKALVLGSNKFIVKVPNFTVTKFIIDAYDLLATNSFKINTFSVREATATEIANYASTVRTNADLQQKGIQQTAFVTDGAGVPTSYSDNLLQFTGDGRYVDTGLIPSASEDWSIEVVTYKATTQTFEGTWGGASNTRCSIGTETNGAIRIDIGSTSKLLAPLSFDSDLYHVEVVYHSSLNTFDIYQNGVIIFASQATDYSAGAITYKYGKYTAALTGTDAPKGSFIFHKNKAHTATEVAQAYAKAKTIYPTLP